MKRDWDKILTECFTELYANSHPKADFGELMKFAKDNNIRAEDGRLDIKCENYEIEESKFEEIFDSYVKKYKIKYPWLAAFSFEIHLGASPKTIRNDKNRLY